MQNIIEGQSKKRLICTVLGLVLAWIILGNTVATAEVVTLIHNERAMPVKMKYTEKMAELFVKEHPNIRIKLSVIPPAEYFKKMLILFATGTVGDLSWTCTTENFGPFASRDVLLNLDPYIETDDYDLKPFYSIATEGLRFRGHLYSLPTMMHPGHTGLFYNIDAFDKAGVEYPNWEWTYDDLLKAAQKLTQDFDQDGKIDQWGIDPPTVWAKVLTVIRSFGGDLLSKDGKRALMAEPESIQAITYVADLINKYRVALSPFPAAEQLAFLTTVQKFSAGRTTMFISGYWDISLCRASVKDFKWAVGPVPLGKTGRVGMTVVDGNAISKISKHPREAWEWLKFLSTKYAGLELARAGFVPAARDDVWFDADLMKEPNHKVFARMMKEGQPLAPLPANFRMKEFRVKLTEGLDLVWLGKVFPQEGAAKVKATIEKILEEPIL